MDAPAGIRCRQCCYYFTCQREGFIRCPPHNQQHQEALRQDLGTYDIDTTPEELERLREEGWSYQQM